MTDINDITALWWSGIRLWYNEQDFLQAMQVWDEAIQCVDDEEWRAEANCTANGVHVLPESTAKSPSASLVAPLLLFLAGCYLDAGETQRARKYCRQCLSTTAFQQSLRGEQNGALAHCALSEYAATFQEDSYVLEPWKVAHQIAEWAIQKRQSTPANNNGVTDRPKSTCWVGPFQRPGFFYPSLISKAIYPREEHPDWCQALEEHFPIIRDEFQQLLHKRGHPSTASSNNESQSVPQHWPKVGAGDHREGAGQHDASVVQEGGDWREMVLFGSGARPDLAPKTCRLLQELAPAAVDLAQEGAGEIIFSVLAPHTHIAPHCASTNLRLTAHLGLQIPSQGDDSQCYIQVAKEKLCWEEGKFLVFDDSFQHEVHNHTKEIRAILLLRFWHPNLLQQQDRQKALQHVLNAKELDRQRRCNPPLPPHGARNPQGMNQRLCPTCGRSGFETIRLVRPDDSLFVCLCGREAANMKTD